MAVYFISDTHFGHKNIHEKFRREFYRKPINIHGHIHDDDVTTENGAIDRRYFNASCEAVGYRPVEFTKIVEWSNQ